MHERIKRLIAIFCVIAGLALCLFGLAAIFGLDSLAFGKFSAAGRDTNSALLLLLVGIALVLFGWFSGAGKVHHEGRR